jgi:hypothetical protein
MMTPAGAGDKTADAVTVRRKMMLGGERVRFWVAHGHGGGVESCSEGTEEDGGNVSA